MKNCMITFRSVTFAQRGEQALRRAGVECRLGRTPRWMEEQGCGYSLHLARQDVTAALAVLRHRELPFRKVYQRREDGTVQELKP